MRHYLHRLRVYEININSPLNAGFILSKIYVDKISFPLLEFVHCCRFEAKSMTWGSKGRSGYGDQHIRGDYDTWSGLSPNGRQWRNPVTLETRDLSGWDYWHTRKANKPQEVPLSMHFRENGSANINAYADEQPTKPVRKQRIAKPIPIRHKISPPQRTLDRLDEQEAELHKEYKSGGLTEEEFFELQSILDLKRQKACKTLQKMQDEIDKAFPKYSGGEYEYPTHPEQKPCVEEKTEREYPQPRQETFWECLQKLTMYSLLGLAIGFILF